MNISYINSLTFQLGILSLLSLRLCIIQHDPVYPERDTDGQPGKSVEERDDKRGQVDDKT